MLNLWAYWCGPCAQELPAMAEYQRRAGSAVTVLTVHQDENVVGSFDDSSCRFDLCGVVHRTV